MTWRVVWRIPASMPGWRARMERKSRDLYFGSNSYATRDEALERARADERKFQQQADDGDITAPPEFVCVEEVVKP